ncbi:MAG: hypothetical protein HQL91_00245 [Magnetococcales bacterium]|nr:hypothetical protein [Magnetococcales bacterium]
MKTTLDQMLAAIEQKRRAEQERILDQARNEAAALLAAAHRTARQRMHALVLQERRLQDQALQTARIQEETEQRNHAMSVIKRHLDEARGQLDSALLARWRDPQARALWIAASLEKALTFLPQGAWTVRHPVDLESTEWQKIRQELMAQGRPEPTAQPDETLEAGLRLGCQGAWVDGSASGLTVNRLAIDAGLLALLQAQGVSS